MLIEIPESYKVDFAAAAKDLGISDQLPEYPFLRPDHALYLTAVYMLAVLIEASKKGEVYDITNHDKTKYEPWHRAKEGYEPGSSAGCFSYDYCDGGHAYSIVGARLSSNSSKECREMSEKYPLLWEIFILNVK